MRSMFFRMSHSSLALSVCVNIFSMRVRLFSGGSETFASPFIARFTGNVCLAVATSLKAPLPAQKLSYDIDGEKVELRIDGAAIPLDSSQGFAQTIVRDTLRGMIRHLKGLDPDGNFRIEVEIGS